MYNFSFICRASKIDKKGFAPIELSIIINGTRTYVILPMKYEPTLFNKMMTSKKRLTCKVNCTPKVFWGAVHFAGEPLFLHSMPDRII